MSLRGPWSIAYADVKRRLAAERARVGRVTQDDFVRACVAQMQLVADQLNGDTDCEVSLAIGWAKGIGGSSLGGHDWPYTVHFSSFAELLTALGTDKMNLDDMLQALRTIVLPDAPAGGEHPDSRLDIFELHIDSLLRVARNGIELPEVSGKLRPIVARLGELWGAGDNKDRLDGNWSGAKRYLRIVHMMSRIERLFGTQVAQGDPGACQLGNLTIPRFSVPEGLRNFDMVYRIFVEASGVRVEPISQACDNALFSPFKSGLVDFVREAAVRSANLGANIDDAGFLVFMRCYHPAATTRVNLDISSSGRKDLGDLWTVTDVLEAMQRELIAVATDPCSVRMLPMFALRETTEKGTQLRFELTRLQNQGLSEGREPFRLQEVETKDYDHQVDDGVGRLQREVRQCTNCDDPLRAVLNVVEQILKSVPATSAALPFVPAFLENVLSPLVTGLVQLHEMKEENLVSCWRYTGLVGTFGRFADWLLSEALPVLSDYPKRAPKASLESALRTGWADSMAQGAAVAHSGLVEIAWQWATDPHTIERIAEYPKELYVSELLPSRGLLYIPLVLEHPTRIVGLCGVDVGDYRGVGRQLVRSIIGKYVPSLFEAIVEGEVRALLGQTTGQLQAYLPQYRQGILPPKFRAGMEGSLRQFRLKLTHLVPTDQLKKRYIEPYEKLVNLLVDMVFGGSDARLREEAAALATQNLAHNIGEHVIDIIPSDDGSLDLKHFLEYLRARMRYLPVLPLGSHTDLKKQFRGTFTCEDLDAALRCFFTQRYLFEGLLDGARGAEGRSLLIEYGDSVRLQFVRTGNRWGMVGQEPREGEGDYTRFHHVFTVIENLLRNMAKHALTQDLAHEVRVTVALERGGDAVTVVYKEQTGFNYSAPTSKGEVPSRENPKDAAEWCVYSMRSSARREKDGAIDNRAAGYGGLRISELLLQEFAGTRTRLSFLAGQGMLQCSFSLPVQPEAGRAERHSH